MCLKYFHRRRANGVLRIETDMLQKYFQRVEPKGSTSTVCSETSSNLSQALEVCNLFYFVLVECCSSSSLHCDVSSSSPIVMSLHHHGIVMSLHHHRIVINFNFIFCRKQGTQMKTKKKKHRLIIIKKTTQ